MICFCLCFDGLRVHNSRHSTSSETLLCSENVFVNRTVRDPRVDCTFNDYFINVTLARPKCKLPDDGHRPKHVAAVIIYVLM